MSNYDDEFDEEIVENEQSEQKKEDSNLDDEYMNEDFQEESEQKSQQQKVQKKESEENYDDEDYEYKDDEYEEEIENEVKNEKKQEKKSENSDYEYEDNDEDFEKEEQQQNKKSQEKQKESDNEDYEYKDDDYENDEYQDDDENNNNKSQKETEKLQQKENPEEQEQEQKPKVQSERKAENQKKEQQNVNQNRSKSLNNTPVLRRKIVKPQNKMRMSQMAYQQQQELKGGHSQQYQDYSKFNLQVSYFSFDKNKSAKETIENDPILKKTPSQIQKYYQERHDKQQRIYYEKFYELKEIENESKYKNSPYEEKWYQSLLKNNYEVDIKKTQLNVKTGLYNWKVQYGDKAKKNSPFILPYLRYKKQNNNNIHNETIDEIGPIERQIEQPAEKDINNKYRAKQKVQLPQLPSVFEKGKQFRKQRSKTTNTYTNTHKPSNFSPNKKRGGVKNKKPVYNPNRHQNNTSKQNNNNKSKQYLQVQQNKSYVQSNVDSVQRDQEQAAFENEKSQIKLFEKSEQQQQQQNEQEQQQQLQEDEYENYQEEEEEVQQQVEQNEEEQEQQQQEEEEEYEQDNYEEEQYEEEIQDEDEILEESI